VTTVPNTLIDYGYKLHQPAGTRRKALARAVRGNGYKSIYQRLSSMKTRVMQSWKQNRLRQDRDWLRQRANRMGNTVFA